MLNGGAMCGFEVVLRESQAPSCESSNEISKVGDPLEGVTISEYRKMIPLTLRVEKKYEPYYCQAFVLRCIVPPFGVDNRSS